MSTPAFTSVGPKGGDLERQYAPEARRAALDTSLTGLHRPRPFVDTSHPGVLNEAPWHHMAAMLLADGRSNTEVAESAGVTPEYIGVLKAQRWFQERIAQFTMDRAKGLAARLAAEADASLDIMIQLRDSSENERIRYTAAKDILEQAHGKAVQKVYSITAQAGNKAPDVEMRELLDELATLRAAQPQTISV